MERFNLEEYKKNPNRKLVTRDGREVRIICWDAKNSKPIVALVLTRSISQREFDELTVSYFNDGTYYGRATEDSLDLFFADEELTELQKTIEEDCECYVNLHNDGKTREELREWIKCWCHRIKELSIKEVLKEQNHYVTIHEDDYCSKLESQYFKGHEDALKKLPKWRKAEKDGHKKLFDERGALEIMNGKICIVQCVTIGDFYIPISELLALPKEECNS